MSKYALFGCIIAWLLMATFIVDSFGSYLGTDEFTVENPIGEISGEGDSNTKIAKSMVSTFLDAMTLQVSGLPNIIAVLFFTIPSFILGFITLELILKFLEAIIPF